MTERAGHVRVVIIGSGFAGIGMAAKLLRAGIQDIAVLERADEVGGTWRDNTYPGCACDVPSALYSFSFAPNPDWTRSYSPQPEIQAYLRRCADRFGIRALVRFGWEVLDATWDEAELRWRIETSAGVLTCDVLVAAGGPLSEPTLPDVPGLAGFRGPVFHSAQWPDDVQLAGRRVAVVGSGASAIQLLPHVRQEASSVVVFQRTPPWVLGHRDRAISGFERACRRRVPGLLRLQRLLAWGLRELLVPGFSRGGRTMAAIERLGRRHIARHIDDAELRLAVTPTYRVGCKRILLSDDWYPAIASPDVTLVPHGLAEVRGTTLVASDGSEHEADVVVLATGFHVTDIPIAQRVHGVGGLTLSDDWRGSPQAYLGASVAGFPNLFLMVGPNTGLGHNSIVYMIESQVRYVLDAIRTMDRRGIAAIDVRREVQDRFNEDVQRRLAPSVWNSGGCSSWYLAHDGANPTIWPGTTWRFRRRTRRFDPAAFHHLARS